MNIEKQNNKTKYTEFVLLTFVWLVIFITPIMFREDIYSPIRRSIMIQIEILLPLLVLFFINRFVLVPKLLFKGKILFFIVSVFGIILLFTIGSFIYGRFIKSPSLQVIQFVDPQLKLPPYSNPGGNDQFGNLRPNAPRIPRPVPPFANFLILSILVVGFDTGLRSGLRWLKVENEKVRLEKDNLDTQLVLLRNQVSPHFLMNTLNNIHSLVDVNTEEAKEAIIKLSRMMRYLLYETETEKTTIKREIEFIESYIELMKLRFSEKVKVSFTFPAKIPDKMIPPFLFTSIIENAFKHGISYMQESFVNIQMTIEYEKLIFVIKNSKVQKVQLEDYSGIGIENTRKRLDLIYGNNYHLEFINNENVFIVNLSVPI